jgi:hypothetical protein
LRPTLLDVQRIGHDCFIGEASFQGMQRPITVNDQRAAALRFADHAFRLSCTSYSCSFSSRAREPSNGFRSLPLIVNERWERLIRLRFPLA